MAYLFQPDYDVKAQDSEGLWFTSINPQPADINRQGMLSGASDKPRELDLELLQAESGNLAQESSLALIRSALLLAHQKSARCVYIEPEESITRLRFRTPGALQEELIENGEFPFRAGSALAQLTGHTVLANNFTSEINLQVRIEKQDYEIQLLPLINSFGESLTIKLRKKLRFAPTLDELDIPRFSLKQLRDIIRSGPGLVLVTGPAGSHKKLSLYALLQDLNSPSHKIISLEKTIQHRLPRVSQIRTPDSPENPQEFARYILEQSADVLCIDKIRSGGIFNKVLRESLNSINLLSSIDAHSAIEGMRKLQASGVDPFALSYALKAILTQQSLRTICQRCKSVCEPNDHEHKWAARNFPGRPLVAGTFTVGEGCSSCAYTGFVGEIRIYELIRSDDDIADAILRNDASALGTAIALRSNFETLKQKAFNLACRGEVPLSQAMLVS